MKNKKELCVPEVRHLSRKLGMSRGRVNREFAFYTVHDMKVFQKSMLDSKEEAEEIKGELELAAEGVSTGLLEWLMSRAVKEKVEVSIETTPEVQTITVRPFEPLRYGCPFQGTCERSGE